MKKFIVFLIFIIALPGMSFAFDGNLPGLDATETADYKRLQNDPENLFPPRNEAKVKQFDALDEKIRKAKRDGVKANIKTASNAGGGGSQGKTEPCEFKKLEVRVNNEIENTKVPRGKNKGLYHARSAFEELSFNRSYTGPEASGRLKTILPRPPMSPNANSFAWYAATEAIHATTPYVAPYAQRALPELVISNPREDLDAREERLKKINRILYLAGPAGTGYHLSARDRINLENKKKELERTILNSRNREWMEITGGT